MSIDHPDLRRCYENVLDAEPGDAATVLHGWTAGVSDLLVALEPLRHKEIPPATPDVDTTWWYRDARSRSAIRSSGLVVGVDRWLAGVVGAGLVVRAEVVEGESRLVVARAPDAVVSAVVLEAG
jgi:hypothetical protein